MDKGIVEGSEDTGNAKDEFTCSSNSIRAQYALWVLGFLTFSDLRAKRDVLGGSALNLLLGRHLDRSLTVLSDGLAKQRKYRLNRRIDFLWEKLSHRSWGNFGADSI